MNVLGILSPVNIDKILRFSSLTTIIRPIHTSVIVDASNGSRPTADSFFQIIISMGNLLWNKLVELH